MNPLDLLYTNRYVGTNEINFDRNKTTRDRINVLKTIDRPFPKRLNRNWEPVIGEDVRDLVKDRYKKRKVTTLCINSQDRNLELYPEPNNYKVVLGSQFNYLESIRIKDIDLGQIFLTKTKITWSYPLTNSYSVDIPCGVYSIKELEETMINYMNSVSNNELNDNTHNFHIELDPISNEIKIINRITSPNVLAIQTIKDEQDDIFASFHIGSAITYEDTAIYILVNHTEEFDDMTLPLIATCLPGIGGISSNLINFQEYWLDPIDPGIGEFEFFDTIRISGANTTDFLRYKLIPKSINGQIIRATYSENKILSEGLRNIINEDKSNYNGLYNIGGCESVGQAQEFTFDFENSPLLELFSWFECDQNFRYILSNKSSFNIRKTQCFDLNRDCCGNYFFRIEPFILLKLTLPSYAEDTLANNIILSQNLPNRMNCENCQDKSGISDIFAKLILTDPIKIESSILTFNETPLEKLEEIIVTFIDRNGCIIDLKCDNTITLEIVELIDVLKDTLIDSRHGEATTTGLLKT